MIGGAIMRCKGARERLLGGTNFWYQWAMGKNTSYSVGPHFSDFIEAQVSEGRYSSASDVVRAGLRLLEEQETKLAALRSALVVGEDSGVSRRSVEEIWSAVAARSGITRG